ncbi:MAG: alkane 1-monooxygenase [Bacteroidota bacterium]|nr:alkane 1-monooxygenase [Bacteroidota bacterium]
MRISAIKYVTILTAPLVGIISLTMHGWLTWLLPLFSFFILPFTELFLNGSSTNLSDLEENAAKNDKTFDYVLYLMVPVQYFSLVYFLFSFNEPLHGYEIAGRIVTMGILCGILGINVAHEIGHRVKPFEQFLAKSLLLTSLYMHFIIEHNRGHHKHVGTDHDPASSKYGEILYAFWFRSIIYSFISAWKIETDMLKKKGIPVLSWKNEMIRFIVIQLGFILLISLIFGYLVMLYFLGAAFFGIVLLETINYVEHYGLRRNKTNETTYERVMPVHSWNSNHPLGRIMLFELSRHSDHHYMASRKYQILRNFENSPQMPTGYPGMILLALVPPLWFKVMHKRIKAIQGQ